MLTPPLLLNTPLLPPLFSGSDGSGTGDNSTFRLYQTTGAYTVPVDHLSLKTEVFTNGPIEVDFALQQDFQDYKGGVYKPDPSSAKLGFHAVALVGWTMHESTPVWVVRNSYGERWGEAGYFLAQMDANMWISAVTGSTRYQPGR